jgi:hypothetical protein
MPEETPSTPPIPSALESGPSFVREEGTRARDIKVPPTAKAKAQELRDAKRKALENKRKAMAQCRARALDKNNHRALIQEKVKKGVPITEDELAVLAGRNKTLHETLKQNIKLTADPMVVLKPQTINALRVIVEQTAAKHAYNPIEGLLEELKDPDLSAKDRVAIHKTLMPFLMPQLGPAKEEHVEHAPQAAKIIIRNYQMAPEAAAPIHQTKRDALADAVDREDQRSDHEATMAAFEVERPILNIIPSTE